MNLAELRAVFVEKSGRYDLITDTGADAGANFFIQSGQRFLDRRADIKAAQDMVSVLDVYAGIGYVEVPNCWLIKTVRILQDSGQCWYPLNRLEYRGSLRYMMTPNGDPRYYVVSTKRHAPSFDKLEADSIHVPADAFTFGDWGLTTLTIELLPHPSTPSSIEVLGRYYSAPLESDQSTSYWSIAHPDVLVKAAMYQLEVFYRNTEGANDWLSSIQLDLTDIEQQEIFQDIEGRDEMGL